MQSPIPDILSTFRRSELAYRTMLDALPAMVYYLDKEYRYSYANAKYKEWLGLDEELLTGKSLNTMLEAGSYACFKNYADQALNGETVRFESDVSVLNTGGTFSIEATLIPDRDEEGTVKGYLALLQDVTDKKRLQKNFEQKHKELQDYLSDADVSRQKTPSDSINLNEEKVRQLIQRLPVAVCSCDAEGRILMYNDAAVHLWGRRPHIGKDLWCGSWKIFRLNGLPLLLEDSPMAVALREKRAVHGEEIIVQRPDGEKRHVLAHTEPIYDDSDWIIGALNTLVDITAMKGVRAELKESEEKYDELLLSMEKRVEERTRDIERKTAELLKNEERYQKMISEVEDYAILLIDVNGIVQNWNKGAEKIKGYREQEIVGKSFKLFYLPEDQASGLPEKLIGEATIRGKALQEGWRRRKNGTAFWGSVLITALHNDMGQVIGFTKVTRDLTEKKLVEEKMSRYLQELDFQNKELEQFAYAASHDMKEPLRKIIFYNSFINDGAGSQLPEKEKLYLSRSINAASRLQRLIDDLLAYSKTTMQLDGFDTVDLDSLLDEVISAMKETIDEKLVVLQRDKLPVVKAIGFQMTQLFDNLLDNAIKYHHPQRTPQIRITCEVVSGGLFPTTDSNTARNFYKISIADNGVGFDTEQSDKIFDLFQRLHEKSDASGTGIGLAICRKIVQNHGGFIKASAKLNEGAVFMVYLPFG